MESGIADADGNTTCIGEDIVLAATRISKSFGTTYALRGADLILRAGKVHAVMGENGAGKSTFVKILVGATRPDGGTIEFAGKKIILNSVREAIAVGIVPIYQHFTLFPHLTVWENLSAFELGTSRKFLLAGSTLSKATARNMLATVGLNVSLEQTVETLSLGERQLLEIARGVGRDCKILILDEPTAALSKTETATLFKVIRTLCARGTAIVYISHKIEEIEAIADDVTVLRDGDTAVNGACAKSIAPAELVRAMLGKEFDTRVKPLPELGDVVLGASNIRPNRQVQPFSLEVRRGEIVGLVGLAGSGALEIAAALAGGKALVQGSLTVNDKTVPINNRCAAVKAGVGFVPADRNAEGLFSLLPAMTNASASMLHITSLWGWIRKGAESKLFTPWAKRLQLNPPSLDLHAGGFSGGNQQKILLFRNLALNGLSVLVVAEPTRGVDIGAREMIHEAIVEAAKNGVAVIMASSDLDEVLQLSHRILVITGGRLTATLPRDAKSEELMSCLAESAAEGTP